jgi:hypothetical protein
MPAMTAAPSAGQNGRMTDLAAAWTFMATHARLLDRRRFDLLLHGAAPEGVLAALDGHGNADGGYGWGIEPDLRSPTSQPAGALHALEVLEEVAPATSPRAIDLCAWLESVTLADGGLPFALPGADSPGSAPFFAAADPSASSLHLTSSICASARRVARHDPAVAGHPWLERATGYCWRTITGMTEAGGSYELRAVLDVLDCLVDVLPGAAAELERVAAFVPPSWERPVKGGLEDERLRPLDFAPRPGRPLRRLVPEAAIERDLERLEAAQRDDGGWEADWAPFSPASALEWRGYLTVRAVRLLSDNGSLEL